MLTNMKSPETYFQAAFRVQSPWTIKNDAGETEIMKRECYVFDFALDRSLRMVSDYSCRLKVDENAGPEEKVGEFINFLPVLAYDGSAMRPVSAADILDIAMAGTSATLLARRWESALLVNVDNDTLRRILGNEEAMRALMSIEGFRNLNDDIETIINRSDAIKKAKREKGELTKKERKEISEEEKELKSKRKQIQEKLIKFATRIPVFMYLTDYREETLKDVITQLEPGLFKKVTGLTVKDFELLVSLGVFNDALMNDAVYKFRRYEDSSLTYAGVDRHAGERVGLFDTTLSDFEYMQMAQQESMVAPNGLATPTAQGSNRAKDVAYTSAETQSQKASTSVQAPKRDWVIDALDDEGIEYVDRRADGGCLWVPGGSSLEKHLASATKRGANFKYSKAGGGATHGRPAWWLKGYPEEREAKPESPLVSKTELETLDVGDAVFHKAFGYGSVVDLSDRYVVVSFENDNHKKKPSRQFGFPSAFYQGLLRIV
jgi:hypothetical protein